MKRYTVQLREHGGDPAEVRGGWSDVWYTDNKRRALRFAALAAATVPRVAEGRVWDTEAGQVVGAEEEREQ